MKSKTFLTAIFCLLGVMLMTSSLNAQDHHHCAFDHKLRWKARQDDEFRRQLEDYKNRVLPQLARTQTFNSRGPNTIYVPIVVHVIHEAGEAIGTGSNLLKERIEAQIEILNEDFSATNPQYDDTPARWADDVDNPDIQFCLAAIDPNGDPTDGITRHAMTVVGTDWNNNNVSSEIQPATIWNSNLYFNIWTLPIPETTAGGGVTGWAGLPTGGTVGSDDDGAVVDWRWFGGPGFGQSGYRTLTHEAGHYLGLFHPFQGESCNDDDGLSDTPNQRRPTSSSSPNPSCNNGYPTGPSTCSGIEHMYINYMDYSRSSCKTSFTKQQIAVMRAVLLGNSNVYNWASRSNLSGNALSACTFYDNDASVAAIQSPSSLICDGNMISPVVTLTNFGFQTLNTVTINYTVNGGMPIATNWVDVLESGGSTMVTLDPFSPPPGTIELVFYTSKPNGQDDEQTINDTLRMESTLITPSPLPLFDDFESMDFDPTPSGIYVDDVSGDGITWQWRQFVSAYSMGGGSAMFDNYFAASSVRGTEDRMLTPTYSFENVSNAQLVFDVAYGPFDDGLGNTGFDTLRIAISTDCATTFDDIVYEKGGNELATFPAAPSAFLPFSNHWRRDTVDLSAYDGAQNLTIAFINKSDYGNRLFLDNINIAPPCTMTVNENKSDVRCLGECNGMIDLTPSGGQAPYTYDWEVIAGPDTMNRVTDLCPGSFRVTVYDSGGCSVAREISIGEPAELEVTATATDLNCNGDGSGTASVAAIGGTIMNDYQYQWSDPGMQTTAMATGLSGGTYTVTVTDDNDCSLTRTVTIDEPTAIELTPTATNLSCNGDANGEASVAASGGNVAQDYQYLWSDPLGQTTATATGLSGGTYTVTVTDDSNCSNEVEVTIAEPEALMVDMSFNALFCFGQNDGTATATVSGGTVVADYQYLWSDPLGQTTATATGLGSGTYTVIITDDNSCTTQASVTLAAPPEITLNGSTTDPDCNGGIGTATVAASGGTVITDYQYIWSDPSGQTTATATGLSGGTYTVTVTDDNNCSKTLSLTINDAGSVALQASTTDVACNGELTGTATVIASGGSIANDYQYAWDDPNMQTTATATGLAAGIYVVTVTDDDNCSSTAEVLIEEPIALDAAVNHQDVNCFGGNDGQVDIDPSGGTAPYTYDFGNGNTNSNQETSLVAGTYTVTITDVNSCTQTVEYTIDQPTELNLTHTPTMPSCNGSADGCIQVVGTGGIAPYTYDIGTGASNDPKFTDLSGGNYIVTVTDDNGCTSTEIVDLPSPTAINLSIIATDATCGDNNGIASVNASGGTVVNDYQYLWSDPNAQTTVTATGLAPGTYTVTVTDDNDCTLTIDATVTGAPDLVVSTSTTDVSGVGQNDGTATATPSGGSPTYTYQWSDPLAQDMATATGLAPGTYTVTVTDANGCTVVETISINGFNCGSFSAQISSIDVICFGESTGSATANPANGNDPYEYVWSIPGQTNATINSLVAGTYTVTITDQSGCQLIEEVTIEQAAEITITATATDETVAGNNDGTATAGANGGTGMLSYEWSNQQSGPTITGLAPGTYTVTVTDENDCIQTATVVVNAGVVNCAGLGMVVVANSITCNGEADGTATADPFGGEGPYEFEWSNQQSGPTITGLTAGVYTVTVTDVNGCSTIQEATVEEPEVIDLSASATDETTAGNNDGTATAAAMGGTGSLNYQWSNQQSGPMISGLAPGTYTVTVTDENECSQTATVTVNAGGVNCAGFGAQASAFDVQCNGDSNGMAGAQASGGEAPYTYNWSNQMTGASISGLSPGTYTVSISDANGCITVQSVMVGEPAELELFPVMEMTSCNGGADGSASVDAAGGVGQYDYNWSNQGSGNAINGLSAGTYTVTVTDGNDCQASITIVVEEPTAINLTASATDESNAGANDGTATANANGGTGMLIYQWSNNQSGPSISGLSAGTYTVTVTDENNCTQTQTVTVNPGGVNCAGFSAVATKRDISCNGAADGEAVAVGFNGEDPYEYEWSNQGTTSRIDGLSAGTYTVTVTDANGCATIQEVTIEEPAAITLTTTATDESNAGANDGTATANANGGTGNLNYEWSNQQVGPTLMGLSPGTYTVTVTDENDCTEVAEVTVNAGMNNCAGFGSDVSSEDASCFGIADGSANVNPFGGNDPYDFAWSNNMNGGSISGLAAGIYTVTITDVDGCEIIEEIVIAEPSALNITMTGNDGNCGGNASAVATVSGGVGDYTYLWSNGADENFVADLAAGTYTVTVTDENGCTNTNEVAVDVIPGGVSADAIVQDVSCFGEADGSIDLELLEGIPPFTFEWSNGETTEDLDSLPAGNYTLFVRDSAGCSYLTTFRVESPAEFGIDFATSPPSNANNDNGQIAANAFGGRPPYRYQWSTGETSIVITDLSIGTYFLTVTDANNCTAIDSVSLTLVALRELESLQSLLLFPNPTRDEINVSAEFSVVEDLEISVLDMLGQSVFFYEEKTRQLSLHFDLQNHPAGTYFLRIRTDEGQVVRKLVLVE